jgi:hypothetical protein
MAGQAFSPAASRIATEAAHRLARLDRKIQSESARLLPDS